MKLGTIDDCQVVMRTFNEYKKLSPTNLTGTSRVFEQELVLLSKLEVPNFCKFFGCVLRENSITLVSEYYALNLFKAIQKGFLSSPKQQYSLVLEIAKGMSFLHALNPPILHG